MLIRCFQTYWYAWNCILLSIPVPLYGSPTLSSPLFLPCILVHLCSFMNHEVKPFHGCSVMFLSICVLSGMWDLPLTSAASVERWQSSQRETYFAFCCLGTSQQVLVLLLSMVASVEIFGWWGFFWHRWLKVASSKNVLTHTLSVWWCVSWPSHDCQSDNHFRSVFSLWSCRTWKGYCSLWGFLFLLSGGVLDCQFCKVKEEWLILCISGRW